MNGYNGFFGHTNATKNTDGSISYTPDDNAAVNPLSLLYDVNNQGTTKRSLGNLQLDYKIHGFEDLRLHANFGADYSFGRQNTLISPYSYSNNYYGWDGMQTEFKYSTTLNAYAQYVKELGNHTLDVMVGGEEQHFHRTGVLPQAGLGTKVSNAISATTASVLRMRTIWFLSSDV